MTSGFLQFFLTGSFNSEEPGDHDGKKTVGKMIQSSGKGNVSDTLKGSNILVIGSFPGTSNIKDAEKKGIKIIDYAILQQGLQSTSPTEYFKNNYVSIENARRRCFQSGDEDFDIQITEGFKLRLNFFYQPNVITEEEEFDITKYLENLKDSKGNLVFEKNETRQSFGCGAKGIKYKADNGKIFPECDWINSPLKNLADKISKMSGISCNYLVIQYYPKGSTYMGAHKDKEVDDKSPIIGISLGKSVRLLRLADKNYTAIHVQQLLPRSMYQLRPPTNEYFTHAITKSDDSDENERWSLNLRSVKK